MGNKSSRQSKVSTKDKNSQKEIKLLLLGPGESGKSTVFKQVKMLYDEGYSQDDMLSYKSIIYANVIATIRALAESCIKNNIPFQNPDNMERAQTLMSMDSESVLMTTADKKYDEKMSNDVRTLWADESIKKQFERRYEFHVFDGATYFFENLARLAPPNYMPTNEDILHCRRKTTGIVEAKFEHEGYLFKLCDVGGQRNERKKWISCFEGVSAILFVVSLSDYDQKCYEDDITNRMNESLDVFEETINNQLFKNTSIILFLNKTDIFRTKIAKKDLKICFPEYTGGCDFEKACRFIETKFMDLNKFDPDRLHTHFTCATNSNDIKLVFEDMKKEVLADYLAKMKAQ
jgi:GTPase SAR1 family protein